MERNLVLCDRIIRQETKEGNIVIHPFREENLNSGSYDLTLGEWIIEQTPERDYPNRVFNPFQNKHIASFWGEPKSYSLFSKEMGEDYGLSEGAKFFTFLPNRMYLAHTEEFVGGRENYCGLIQTKSSLGRCGLTVCRCAGFVQPSYVNRITLELRNDSPYPMVLEVGKRIAQIIFIPSSTPEKKYSSGGRYQSSDDLDEIIKGWRPEMMIPYNKN